MKDTWADGANFAIYDFMTEEMKLSGAQLLVFALIFSFTKTAGGFCGARSYAARATGTTLRTVDRALEELTKKGYLTKEESEGSATPIYRANAELAEQMAKKLAARKAKQKRCKNGICQNSITPVPKCQLTDAKIAPNNSMITNNINCLSSSSKRTRAYGHSPRFKVESFGRDGGVSLTMEQYEYLCYLIGEEILTAYIRKLELYMENPNDHPIRSHFKTLCRFIKEDFSLSEGIKEKHLR